MKIFYRFVRSIAKGFFYLFYSHRVFGKKNIPKGPCILAPNHASFFDPPLVGISCDDEVNFLARGSLFNNRLFKKIISNLNSYPVTGTGQDSNSLKLIIQFLQDQKKVVIFPEGKRTLDGSLLPIKPGIGMLVARCQCPIVPVYIHGTYDIWPKSRTFPKFWGKTACVFGMPISWDQYKELPKKQAQEEIAKAIQQSLKLLQDWYLNGAMGHPP